MKVPVTTLIFATALAAFSTSPALAQDMSLGEFEYRNSCIACHGPEGNGDGPIAQYLETESLPQLSMLQKNNGGVFPVQRVYEVIDGSQDVAVHGGREMPVWGERYRGRLDPADDADMDPDEYTTTRILALIEYLASIQSE